MNESQLFMDNYLLKRMLDIVYFTCEVIKNSFDAPLLVKSLQKYERECIRGTSKNYMYIYIYMYMNEIYINEI